MNKKEIREKFKREVFKRDNYTCKVCKKVYGIENSNLLDAHHIVDRSEIISGGYVKENGITVCKESLVRIYGNEVSCHMKCEKYHISGGTECEEGLHPDDLYKLIKSSKDLAIEKSKLL